MFSRSRITAAALVLMLLIAGCGQRGTPTPTSTVPAETPPAAAPGDWRSHHLDDPGITFDVPAGWQPAGENRLEGADGFVMVETRPDDGAAPAAVCQVEANREKPGRFGAYPEIVDLRPGSAGNNPGANEAAASLDGALPGCLILPSPDQPAGREDAALALLWTAPRGGSVIAVHASRAHAAAIAQSLRLDNPPAAETPPAGACEFDPDDLRPEVWQQGELRIDAFPIARGAGCSPLEQPLEFDTRVQQGLPAARAAAVLAGQWSQERINRLNRNLKPFGFFVETYDERLFRVIKDNQVVRTNINWIGQMTVKTGGNDFILPMIDSYNAVAYLLRPFGVEALEEWDLLVFDNIFPIYVDSSRVRLAYDYQHYPRPTGYPALVQVLRDEEVVDTFSVSGANPAGGPVRGLWAWQDGWLMELPGVLIQDGVVLNEARGYSEMFAWRLLRDKPFYLYRDDGRVQASYDGETLALDFDEVLYEPQWTTAMLVQIKKFESGLLFFARRGDVWYYVVVAA